jgi:FAD dependent oxidoreductase TIGR03364
MFDAAIAGAGILGLAHAYQFARRGLRVVVCERRTRAEGASIRNFGMLWPIGQPAGETYHLAMQSRQHWLNVLQQSGLWHDRVGSLHLAYHDDEAQILQEFVGLPESRERECEIWDAVKIVQHSPWVNPAGLKLGLWSPREVCVDPRQVVANLPAWLTRTFGVEFRFGTAIHGFAQRTVHTSAGNLQTARLVVCTGEDFLSLYPEVYASTGQARCKLQMLRSQPYSQRLGPMLAAGLTLLHYKNFATCPTLPALQARVQREQPDYLRYGIHVMASQHGSGEITIGDSHEYGDDITIFDKPIIDELIVDYLKRFLLLPDLQVRSRWHGIYAKHPSQSHLLLQPEPDVTVVTGVGGAGMTLSFGVAEKAVRQILGEKDDVD